MESKIKSKSKLKQQLNRFFQPSKLVNKSCNATSSSSTIFTSSSSPNTGSTRSDDPSFITTNGKTLSNNKLDRALSFNSSSSFRTLSFDLANLCKPTKKSHNNDVVTNVEANHESALLSSSPLKVYFEAEKIEINKKKKKKKNGVFQNAYGFSSSSEMEESEFFSTNEVIDKEDETEVFFSSRSFDSFESCNFYKRPSRTKKKKKNKKKKKVKSCRKRVGDNIEGIPVIMRSIDPYLDFKDSMLEMIVERQMFGDEDLKRLVYSYLSLNSPLHHPVILRAFDDVLHALFGC